MRYRAAAARKDGAHGGEGQTRRIDDQLFSLRPCSVWDTMDYPREPVFAGAVWRNNPSFS
jgi:hypothetical protein